MMISRDRLYRSQNKYQVKYQSKIHNPQNPKTSPSLHPNPTLSLSPDQRQAGRRERGERARPIFCWIPPASYQKWVPKKRIKFQKEQEMTQSTRGKKRQRKIRAVGVYLECASCPIKERERDPRNPENSSLENGRSLGLVARSVGGVR
jgi:hypothetical protein